MKAHLNRDPRCVLVWNFGPEHPGYGVLELAARHYRLRLRAVAPEELNTRIGDLIAGRPAASAVAGTDSVPPALSAIIISGLSPQDGSLHEFLDEIRRGGADIPLRAMVTPTSRDWSLGALLHELNAEHQALRGDA